MKRVITIFLLCIVLCAVAFGAEGDSETNGKGTNSAVIGFVGVIVGAVITFCSQLYIEKRREKNKNREIFLKRHAEIQQCIYKIKLGISHAQSFIKQDLDSAEEKDLWEYVYNPIVRIAKEGTEAWAIFNDIFFEYFQKVIKSEDYNVLDKAMFVVDYVDPGPLMFANSEMFKNNQDRMKKHEEELLNALKIINSLEEKYREYRRELLWREM